MAYRGNSFDTHVHQADLHSRLLMYTADAVRGFMEDVIRIGRGDDVAVMIFTEFGRRIEENASKGTDHGTAGPMFVVGGGRPGRVLWRDSKPHRHRQWQSEDDHGLSPRLRDDDLRMDGAYRHEGDP